MKYKDIPKYSIICYSNNTLLGEAQKHLTNALITHVSRKIDNEYVLENSLGIKYTKFKDTLKHADLNNLYVKIPNYDINESVIRETIDLSFKLKIRYSILELFYLLYYRFTGIWKGDQNVKTSVCSNYQMWIENRITNLYPNWPTYTPQMIFEDNTNFRTEQITIK